MQVMVNNMELTANEAEPYLVGGQLKKIKRKGKVPLYNIRGETRQLHIHLRQYKTGPKRGGKHFTKLEVILTLVTKQTNRWTNRRTVIPQLT